MADENDEQVGEKVRSASAAAAERIRNSPPPAIRASSAAPSAPAAPAAAPTVPASESTSDDVDGGESPSPKVGQQAPQTSGTKKVSRLVSASATEAAAPTHSEVPGSQATPDEEAEAAARWLAMHGGDQKKANAAALKTNNRAAELARASKDNKAPAAPADAAAPKTAPTTETPAATDDVDPNLIDTEARKFATEDQECRAYHTEWTTNDKRLNEIVKLERGVPVSGELVDLSRRISALNNFLDPKAAGIEQVSELDPVTRDEYQRELERAESKRERLLNEHQRLETRNGHLSERYERRVGAYRDRIVQEARNKAQASKLDEEHAQIKAASETEWQEGFDVVAKGVTDPEDRAYLQRNLLLEANAVFEEGGDIPDFKTWIAEKAKRHLAYIGRKAGAAEAEAARQKDRDNRQPAPRGAAAVAEVPSSSDLSPRDRRKAAELRAHQAARNIRAV